MPDPNDLPQNPDDPNEFEIETETPERPSDFRRSVSGCTVSGTGHVQTNTNGSLTLEQLRTENGLSVAEHFYMKFGAKNGVVAGYLANEGEPGAIPVKRIKGQRIYTFHLAYLFAKNPPLRPTGEIFCTLKKAADAKGTPCIKVYMKGAVQKKGRATKGEGTPDQTPDGSATRDSSAK